MTFHPTFQRRPDDCLSAAVASVVGCPLDDVPYLPADESIVTRIDNAAEVAARSPGFVAFDRWARDRGLEVRVWPRCAPVWSGHWVAVVNLRPFGGTSHAVVFRGRRFVHDPAPPLVDRVAVDYDRLDPSLILYAITVEPVGKPKPKPRWVYPIGPAARIPAPDELRREVVAVPGAGVARASSAPQTAGAVKALDNFAGHSAGNLGGKTAPVGGTWARVAGDTTEATINTLGNGAAQRTATSDTDIGNTDQPGILYRLGSGDEAGIDISDDHLILSAPSSSDFAAAGLLCRYVDADNWLIFYRFATGSTVAGYQLVKAIDGSTTVLRELVGNFVPQWRSLRLAVDDDGRARAYRGPQGNPNDLIFDVTDSDLATGGDLASGGYGLYDANTSSSALVARLHDNFGVREIAPSQPALYAGQSVKFTHNAALRENSAGTSWGRVPVFEGKHLRIPPSTQSGRKTRICVLVRRKSIDAGQPSDGLDDSLEADLSVTPRVLLTGGDGT